MQSLLTLLETVSVDKEPEQQLDILQQFDTLSDDEINELLCGNYAKYGEAGIVIRHLGFAKLANKINELLNFLQDANWSAARHVSILLTSIGKPVIPAIKKVFKEQNDPLWHYWILCCVVQKWDTKTIGLLKDELLELVKKADKEGAAIEALGLLKALLIDVEFKQQFDYLMVKYEGDNYWLDELQQPDGETKASR